MKFKIFLIFFAISLISFSQNKGTEETPSKVYTLDECIKIALEKNPDIELSKAKLSNSAADITSAFGDFLPSLSVSSEYHHFWGGNYTISGGQMITIPEEKLKRDNFSAGFNAQYVLFNGFSRENNYQRAKETFNSIFQSTEFTKEQIKFDIYRTYTNVILNKQILKIRKENYELGLKELERIKARYEGGLITINFVYSQEADVGSRELEVIKAQNDLKNSYTTVLSVMGMNPDIDTDFSEESLPKEISDIEISDFNLKTGNFDNALSVCLNSRLDYKAALANIIASEKSLSAANGGYYPSLFLQGGWQWNNSKLANFNELSQTQINLGLTIPVFDNFKTNARIETAKYQVTSSQLQKFQLEQSIRSSLKSALLNLSAAEKQLAITARSLNSAQKNYDYANERFRTGATSIADYFVANNLMVTGQINRITAVYNYFIAKKQVEFAMGKLN